MVRTARCVDIRISLSFMIQAHGRGLHQLFLQVVLGCHYVRILSSHLRVVVKRRTSLMDVAGVRVIGRRDLLPRIVGGGLIHVEKEEGFWVVIS